MASDKPEPLGIEPSAGDTAFMTMPLYEGRTLRAVLRESPKPDEAWLLALVVPLLDALETLHSSRCYHCDVSPDNILVLENGKPVLLDFEAARRIIDDMTQGTTVILTPGYAPLEQYADDPALEQGAWTDIYSVAAVLYFAITGAPPPTAVTRVVDDTLEPLRDTVQGYSTVFLAGIDGGLAVRPQQRPQTIDAFRQALGIAYKSAGSSFVAQAKLAALDRERSAQRFEVATEPGERKSMESRDVLVKDRYLAEAGASPADDDSATTPPFEWGSIVQPESFPCSETSPLTSSDTTDGTASDQVLAPLAEIDVEPATQGRQRKSLAIVIAVGALATGLALYWWSTIDRLETPAPRASQIGSAAVAKPEMAEAPTEFPRVVTDVGRASHVVLATPADEPGPALRASSLAPPQEARPALAPTVKDSMQPEAPTGAAPAARQVRAPAPTGVVLFLIRPWGEIVVNGKKGSYSPPTKKLSLPEGRYTIEIRNGGFPSVIHQIEVKAGNNITIEHTFK